RAGRRVGGPVDRNGLEVLSHSELTISGHFGFGLGGGASDASPARLARRALRTGADGYCVERFRERAHRLGSEADQLPGRLRREDVLCSRILRSACFVGAS